MAKTRALVKRRKAIRNIRKITRTMELIATARFKRAMDRAVQAESYTHRISDLVRDVSSAGVEYDHPLLEVHEPAERAKLLVLTANRGLCGGYNANVLRVSTQQWQQWQETFSETSLEVSGKRGIGAFRYRGITADQSYVEFEDRPRFDEVEAIAERYMADYAAGKLDRLDVVYTRFISTARQEAVVETLLPLSPVEPEESSEEDADNVKQGAREVQYELLPSPAGILEEILPMAFKVRLFKCFLDAAVSEQVARMIAMKGATENSDNIIREISMLYNRARQAEITKQIAEIVGGAELLN